MTMTPELERALRAFVKQMARGAEIEARLERVHATHDMDFTLRSRDECYHRALPQAKRVAKLVRKQVQP